MRGRAAAAAAVLVVVALVAAACQSWTTVDGDGGRTGYNPVDTAIGLANVSSLAEAYVVPGATTAPVFNGDVGFVGRGNRLIAYSRTGDGCSGTPVTCPDLWYADLGAAARTLVVAEGMVYVTSAGVPAAGSTGGLWAFVADGGSQCTGTPLRCQAMWRTSGISPGWVAADGPTVLVGDGGTSAILAFDTDAQLTCSAAITTTTVPNPLWNVCPPTWRTMPLNVHASRPPAIAGRRLVATMDGLTRVAAFDLDGTLGCTGTPTVCQPLWTGAVGPYFAEPMVHDGTVYVAMSSAPGGASVLAFDLAGVVGCTGSPAVCQPLWGGVPGSPLPTTLQRPGIASGGHVLVPVAGGVAVFDQDAAQCSGPTPACAPSFTLASGLGAVPTTSVAAGELVFAGTAAGIGAFDAAGVQGCTGTPVVCAPIWTVPSTAGGWVVAVLDGRLYVRHGGALKAFAVPAT